MSNNPSLTSIIAELGFLKEPELGEVQAREVIYGGDQELNLLELGAVTEEQLLATLEIFTGFPRAAAQFLSIDLGLSERALGATAAMGAGLSVVVGIGEEQKPLIYTSEPLDDETQAGLLETIGRAGVFRAAPRLRIAEAKSTLGLGKLTVREASLLERLGPRPVEAQLHTTSSALEPAPVRSSSLDTRAPLAVETAPPPEGYEELTASSHQKDTETKTGRPGPRLKYSTSEAIADLSGARSRDRVIDVFVHYAAQFFEYAAVFAVLSKVAKGLSARGNGTGTDHIKKLKIPLDLPSAFRKAQTSTAPQITRLRASGLEGGIARDLDRPTGREILLLPIGVRGRTVLILWGDRGREGVDYQSLAELLSFAPSVSLALERVLILHVRASRAANPTDHEQRETLHTPVVPPPATPTPVPSPQSHAVPFASPPTTRRNPAAPAAQPPNFGAGHEVAQAEKRAFGGPRPPSEHPESRQSEPPMNFPAENPKTIRGFPTGSSQREEFQSFETKDGAPKLENPSPRPPLVYRRIVPLDSVVRIQSDPPMASDDRAPVPSIAPPPPLDDFDDLLSDDVPVHSSRGTLMSRRPPVYEPSEEGWGADDSSSHARVPPVGRVTRPRGKSGRDLVQRLLGGDESVIHQLVESGDTAVGALIAEFPGPVQEPKSAHVPASECGPILRALVALGSKATPFLTVRTADEDANVRRWATFVLGELPGKEAAKAIAGRLLDDSTEVRRAALASARRARKDVLTRRTLRAQMEELCRDVGLSAESRAAAIEALADIREHEAIPTLLQLLDDEDPSIVRASRWALSVLTRQDFGANSDGWKRFWREHRDLDRVEWLISSLDHEQRDLRRASGEELKALAGQDFGFNEDLDEPERRLAQAEFRRWWITSGKASES